MKRLLLILLILVNLSAMSQTVFVARKSCSGVINSSGTDWVWEEDGDCYLKFTFQRDILMVSDKNRSVYNLHTKHRFREVEGITQIGWDSKDEKGRSCLVKVVKQLSDNSCQIYVMYLDHGIAFCYSQISDE